MDSLFSNSDTDTVRSTRIIYTPSSFARSSLIHLQETGTLQALHPHKSERSGLCSCLFFTVLSGAGKLSYGGKSYDLHMGDCVFIDCRKPYSHETGFSGAGRQGKEALWSLQWCHFYGPNMNAIYQKYLERGGRPVFHPERLLTYRGILEELYQIADSADYVRDMRIQEKLSSLLILLMEDAWDTQEAAAGASAVVDIQQVKEYLDANYTEKITLDDLAARFFINKYYLLTLFKDRYGVPVNTYLNQVRVTYVKRQLRFTGRTVESLADELHIEPAYLSRLFKKVEGVSPSEFRKSWKGDA
ncbi:MAG TPA: AraC family transcriptional regulator [Candidatus Eisenbergiella merdipullorum]|uniref:AraC family transcriptional regulator n=1 Tax=Candidatus Eisenbergiella merdipullorum TaxID=2838553 RepID=A0A9D2I859_9FIRM|nr:AraC family transcriptional regulator [Candidatus Eisenbergiella merdipullorum]